MPVTTPRSSSKAPLLCWQLQLTLSWSVCHRSMAQLLTRNHSWVIFQHLAPLSCLSGNEPTEIQINLLFPSLTHPQPCSGEPQCCRELEFSTIWAVMVLVRALTAAVNPSCGSSVWHSAEQRLLQENSTENNKSPRVRDSTNSELEILRAGFPGRFAAFQASNPLNSGAAASQKRKEKLTTA